MTTTMTTRASSVQTPSALAAVLVQIGFVAMMGLGLLFAAGHAQSETLHDAAHDVRHATGFPCH